MSPTISRTAVLASASMVAASALVFGAVAAASAAPQPRAVAMTSSSSSPATSTATETPTGSEVYADITVTIERDDVEVNWVKVIKVTGVVVGDGVELDYGSDNVEEINEWGACLGVSVDVSLDPQKVEFYDDSPECFPERINSIQVVVKLTGATFGTVTVGSDSLFSEPIIESPEDDEPGLDQALGMTSQGNFRFGRSVVSGLAAPFPVLTSATVSGSTFSAAWTGTEGATIAGGSAAFVFAAPAAPGATPVLATPVFTG